MFNKVGKDVTLTSVGELFGNLGFDGNATMSDANKDNIDASSSRPSDDDDATKTDLPV